MSYRSVPLDPSTLRDVQLLRLADAAAIAGLSVRTIRRALRASTNRLRCYRFGRAVRIAPDDLTEWLHAHVALPVVSSRVTATVSAEAKELIKGLNQSANRGGSSGDRTAKVRSLVPDNNLAPKTRARLDCEAESSVHVPTDTRSKEEPISMHNASQMTRFRANPARTPRAMR